MTEKTRQKVELFTVKFKDQEKYVGILKNPAGEDLKTELWKTRPLIERINQDCQAKTELVTPSIADYLLSNGFSCSMFPTRLIVGYGIPGKLFGKRIEYPSRTDSLGNIRAIIDVPLEHIDRRDAVLYITDFSLIPWAHPISPEIKISSSLCRVHISENFPTVDGMYLVNEAGIPYGTEFTQSKSLDEGQELGFRMLIRLGGHNRRYEPFVGFACRSGTFTESFGSKSFSLFFNVEWNTQVTVVLEIPKSDLGKFEITNEKLAVL